MQTFLQKRCDFSVKIMGMYRMVFYLALIVAVFSALGVVSPYSLVNSAFLLPNGVYAAAGLIVSLLLLDFSVAAFLRKAPFKIAFGIIGLILAGAAVIGVASPTYFGLLQFFVRPVNLLVLMMSGVGCLLSALEYGRPSLTEELRLLYDQFVWRQTVERSRWRGSHS